MPPELLSIDASKVETAAADGPLSVIVEVYAQITAAMQGLANNEADLRDLQTWRLRALRVELGKWLAIAESQGWLRQ
jgi:hypothetical protein